MSTFRRLWLATALVLLLLPGPVRGEAPPRASGIPYAEAALCARADVILCEDFEDSTAESGYHFLGYGSPENRWGNPAFFTNDARLKTQRVAANAAEEELACPACPGGRTRVVNPPSPPGTPGGHSLRGDYLPPFANNSGAGGRLRAPYSELYIRYQIFRSKAGLNGDAADFRFPARLDDKDIVVNPTPPNNGGPADAPYEILTYLSRDTVCRRGDSFEYQPGVLALANNAKSTEGSTTAFGSALVVDNRKGGPRVLGHCPAPEALRVKLGRWQTVEMHIKLNREGSKDGLLDLWLDGTQVVHLTGAVIRGTDPSLVDITPSFTYGDGLQCYFHGEACRTWQAPFYKWLDNLVVATRPIGPPAAPEPRADLPSEPPARTQEHLSWKPGS